MKKIAVFIALIVLVFFSMGCEVSPDARFRVNYNGNGATSGYAHVDRNEYKYGENAVILNQNTLLKTGYTFQNWNTRADGSGSSYEVGSSIRIVGPVFLYAVWK